MTTESRCEAHAAEALACATPRQLATWHGADRLRRALVPRSINARLMVETAYRRGFEQGFLASREAVLGKTRPPPGLVTYRAQVAAWRRECHGGQFREPPRPRAVAMVARPRLPRKRQPPQITIATLRHEWQCCYSEAQLLKLYAGRDALTPFDFLTLKVPVADRLWVLLHDEIIPSRQQFQLGWEFIQDVLPGAPEIEPLARVLQQAHHFWLYGALSYDELLEQRDWFENETPYVNSNDRLYTVREAVLCATTNSCREASYTTSRVLSGLPVSRAKHLKMVGAMLRRLYHEPAA